MKLRESYTVRQKLQVVEMAKSMKVKDVVETCGLKLNQCLVYKWIRSETKLRCCCNQDLRSIGSGRRPNSMKQRKKQLNRWVGSALRESDDESNHLHLLLKAIRISQFME